MSTLISILQRFKSVLFLKETVMSKFYAVAVGRNIGIYTNWQECELQVKNFPQARFKKFLKRSEAENFIATHGVAGYSSSKMNQTERPQKISKITSSEEKSVAGNSSRGEQFPRYEETWPEDDLEGEFEEFAKNLNTDDKLVKRKQPYIRKSDKINSTVINSTGLKKYGNNMFPIDSEGFVLCYTDGSCENNGLPNAVAGFGVYFNDNHPLNTSQPVSGRATNNCGEIQGAIYAVRCAKENGIEKLCINTDSQFLIKAITTWVAQWKKRGWKLAGGQPVKNVEDFKALDKELQDKKLKIKWNYVAGHKGILGNEKADELARRGAQMYRDTRH